MLHRFLVAAHVFAKDSTGLCPIILHTDLETLLCRVKVLLEVGLDFLDDTVRLQLACQLQIYVQNLQPVFGLLSHLVLHAVLCHRCLGLIHVDFKQFIGVHELLMWMAGHTLCES